MRGGVNAAARPAFMRDDPKGGSFSILSQHETPMKRIIIASFAFFTCAAAFAQSPAHHPHHHGKHHNTYYAHRAHAQRHVSHTNDSVADRAEPLDTAHFKP